MDMHTYLYTYASLYKCKTNLDILQKDLISSAGLCTGNLPQFINANRFHIQLVLILQSFEEEFHAVNKVHLD